MCVSYIFIYPTSTVKTGMLRLSRDSESSNGVVESRHIHRLNVVRHHEHHVRAGHPHSGRGLPAETLQGAHQSIDVCLDLCLLKVDGFISRLVGRGISHEGMATRTEGKGRALRQGSRKNIITLVQLRPSFILSPLSKLFQIILHAEKPPIFQHENWEQAFCVQH